MEREGQESDGRRVAHERAPVGALEHLGTGEARVVARMALIVDENAPDLFHGGADEGDGGASLRVGVGARRQHVEDDDFASGQPPFGVRGHGQGRRRRRGDEAAFGGQAEQPDGHEESADGESAHGDLRV